MINGMMKLGGVGLSLAASVLGLNIGTDADTTIDRSAIREEIQTLAETEGLTVREYVDTIIEEKAIAEGVTVDEYIDVLKDENCEFDSEERAAFKAEAESQGLTNREYMDSKLEELASEEGLTLDEYKELNDMGPKFEGMGRRSNRKAN